MKVALAIWNDRISPVFDVSRQILILEIENGKIIENHVETFTGENPFHKISKLESMNIQTLICGAVSRPLSEMLDTRGIQTISFIAGDVKDVIAAYLSDTLPNPKLMMPGCCQKRRRLRYRLDKEYV